jgi:hypothetical protein
VLQGDIHLGLGASTENPKADNLKGRKPKSALPDPDLGSLLK